MAMLEYRRARFDTGETIKLSTKRFLGFARKKMNPIMQRIICILVLMACFAFSRFAAAEDRPHVLFICADDHAAYMTGCYGANLVRTPNIDRIATAGMRFDRAYCNSPVCTASRASFITGRYPRTVGVTQLRTALPEQETTLAEYLAEVGYRTLCVGKTHFNSNRKHGFEELIGPGQWQTWLAEKGGPTQIPKDVEVLPTWRPFRQPARLWVNGVYRPQPYYDADMLDAFYAQTAAERIAAHDAEQPLLLYVSFTQPHSPFRFPVEYAGRLDPSAFPVPRVGPEDDWQIPACFADLTDAEKQGVQASYATAVEYLDKNVGLVLDALDAAGMTDDALIVYFGDHGYMLGQHGRIEKHCSYEEAIRVPLLFDLPGEANTSGDASDALVELIDMLPTILDYCDVEVPERVQGRSLRDVLEGRSNEHRERVFVEYAQNDEVLVRDRNYKLIYERGRRRRTDGYDTGKDLPGPLLRLYDMQHDPAEMHNLADDPAYAAVVEEYTNLLVEHLVATDIAPERLPTDGDLAEILAAAVRPREWDGTGYFGEGK